MAERTETDFEFQSDPENPGGGDPTTSAEGPETGEESATTGDRSEEFPPDHDYPPDALFEGRFLISFTATVAILAVLSSAASIYRVGFPDTPVPYNYPLFAGVIYVVAVLFVLRRYHAIFDATKKDLARVLERTEAATVVFERDDGDDNDDITPDQLVEEFEEVMDCAFHPGVIFVGGLIGGVFALAAMWVLDVFDAYPYVFLDYAYGAGHGFFYGPFLGSLYLIHRISNRYIIDVDVLAPDGVGGYRGVGDAIVTLVTYGILLVTLDFVILSSASFLDRPVFRTAVFVIYGAMLAFLLGLTFYGIGSFRRGLLDVRERKIDAMREKFKEMEVGYWRKLDRNETPEPEATHIDTMNTMFEKLQNMALWPINLRTFFKLAVTTIGSISVTLLEFWLKTGELPAAVVWLL